MTRRKARPFTDEEHERIDAMLRDGATHNAIGAALDRAPAVVGRYARRHGLAELRCRRLSPAQEARVLDLYIVYRIRVQDIPYLAGVGQGTIYALLHRHTVPLRSPAGSAAVKRPRPTEQEATQ